MAHHRFVGIARRRVFGSSAEVFAGPRRLAGLQEMLGCQAEKVFGAGTGQGSQPACRHAVVATANALEHGGVRDLLQDVVAERVLANPVEPGLRMRRDQRSLLHGGQRVGRVCVDGDQGLVPEHVADHRSPLQGQLFGRSDAVEPGLQHAGQGGRHAGGQQLVGMHRPALAVDADGAFVDQHLDQLFHVERVAFGAAGDQRPQRVRNVGQALQQFVGELAAGLGGQRAELDAPCGCGGGPVGVPLVQGRARQRECQHRHVAQHPEQVVQEVE